MQKLRRRVAELERALFGSRRERYVNADGANQTSEEAAPNTQEASVPAPLETSAPPTPPQPLPPATSPRRTSKGRQPRVLDESYPREKVYHRLDERDVPPALWNHPRARRFFRFVREEVELQKAHIRVIQHYEEVIALEDEQHCHTQMLAASAPEPLIDR